MGKNTTSFGYRNVFIFFGAILIILAFFRCQAGLFPSSLLFVMPHMEKLHKIIERETDKKTKRLLKGLFWGNVIIAAMVCILFFSFDVDVDSSKVKPAMLISKNDITLFSFSFEYLYAAAVDILWCGCNTVFNWRYK